MNGSGPASDDAARDVERVRGLAAGDDACLRELYARHAPWIFALALRSLDRASAEEIVQDVFVALWRNAARFDPERGSVRGWLSVIAQRRISNELRGQSRRPRLEAQDAGGGLEVAADPGPGPAGLAWQEYRRTAVRSALETLPREQRQALGLAFLEELSHEQVAELLGLRLGTAKSRIRAALAKLRAPLAPLVAVLALLLLGGLAGIALRERAAESLDSRAIDLLTSSDVVPLRLESAATAQSGIHATYRALPGTPLAVMTYTHFPAAPAGASYQAWARHGAVYTPIGAAQPDANGHARIVAEGAAFATAPDGLLVTLEPGSGSTVPTGQVVVAWPKE
jgi:RNA polymerase sigma factor (sigma-70 family)